ncbi:MAG: hypothetical protein MEP57_05740 [Microvirga sp.]|nr:hypothetical protein [Microvirga sp.]
MDGRVAITDQGARSRGYAGAVRHSRRVRVLRRAIPIAAFGAVALVVAVTLFNPFASVGGLTIGPVSVSGTRIVMDAPRLRGFQDGSRPYEVTAEEASQDVREPHLVDLRELRARLTVDDAGATALVESATGRFDTHAEILELNRDVRVVSSSGYTLDLSSATVDFKGGGVVSNEPVRLVFESGSVEAGSMSIVDSGAVITFEGGVSSVFAAPALGARPPAAGADAPQSPQN